MGEMYFVPFSSGTYDPNWYTVDGRPLDELGDYVSGKKAQQQIIRLSARVGRPDSEWK